MHTTSTRGLAVVIGASSGIGLELAKQFADNGFDLIVAAEDAGLDAAATELSLHGARVDPVRLDLATAGGVEELYGRMTGAGRPIDAIALNAGIGRGGAVTDAPVEDLLRVVDLNVRSTVHLARLAAADMVRRGEGRILLTSSIASTQPGTFHAVYNASKSFVQSFAVALRKELEGRGVTVTSLMPGPTETNFFARAKLLDTRLGTISKDDPADVARQGFEALMNGDERVAAASLATKLQAHGSRFVPDSAKAAVHRVLAKPGGGS